MKAALQNLVLYLLCVASVVLAAPTQSTLLPRPLNNSGKSAEAKHEVLNKPASLSPAKACKAASAPSILDGTTRFILW
ncbi:MAG: hypothetical protein GXC72_12250 [Chitinophagaceae bacterium]|jgi:hypothetical protein|nr:hypothetical protein [Chitinophagaceae bacterium]